MDDERKIERAVAIEVARLDRLHRSKMAATLGRIGGYMTALRLGPEGCRESARASRAAAEARRKAGR